MTINPVAHALVLLRGPFYHDATELLADPVYLRSLAITVVWTAACLAASLYRVNRRDQGVVLA